MTSEQGPMARAGTVVPHEGDEARLLSPPLFYIDVGGVPGYHTSRDRLTPSEVTWIRREHHVECGAAAALLRGAPVAGFALVFGT